MSATDIRIAHESGYIVKLEREGKTWPLPAESRLAKDEWPQWRLHDVVRPGDRLILADSIYGDYLVGLTVVGSKDGKPLSFFEQVYGRLDRISLFVFAHTICPACTDNACHHIDIPDDLSEIQRDVLRTCITCDHAWRERTHP